MNGMAMTEVIHTNKSKKIRPKDQIILNKYCYVEMKPFKALPIYQFKLYPHSKLNGAYVLIKYNSEILKYLNPGGKINIIYYPKETDATAEYFETQISDITKKEQGPFKGHFKVALSIVDW
jgi:hypothetical protein